MSITASYRRLLPEEFQSLLSDPRAATIFGLVNMDDLDSLDDADELDSSESEANLEASGRYLDIGKYWHVLHFLLTGEAKMDKTEVPPPLGNVVLGGTETKWEATYGMVRYLTPEQVRDVAFSLEAMKVEDLRCRDLTTFGAVHLYGDGGAGDWDTEDLEEMIKVFSEVRDFFSQAAREGNVVLLSKD